MVKRKKLKTTYWKLKSTEESSNWLKRAKKPEVQKNLLQVHTYRPQTARKLAAQGRSLENTSGESDQLNSNDFKILQSEVLQEKPIFPITQ